MQRCRGEGTLRNEGTSDSRSNHLGQGIVARGMAEE